MSTPRNDSPSRAGLAARALRHSLVVAIAVSCSATLLRAEPAAAPELRLPPDAIYQGVVGPDSAVVFRHGTHVALASNRCTDCHPKLFRILKPTGKITHADMNAGRSCGSCHDGQHAFGVREQGSCASCHAGRPRAVPAVAGAAPAGSDRPSTFRGPKPIVYTPSDVSPGRVTFRHTTHAQGECAGCHPRLFPMKSSAARPRDGMHETTACGACHDGKKTFGVEDDQSCERCHKEAAK